MTRTLIIGYLTTCYLATLLVQTAQVWEKVIMEVDMMGKRRVSRTSSRGLIRYIFEARSVLTLARSGQQLTDSVLVKF